MYFFYLCLLQCGKWRIIKPWKNGTDHFPLIITLKTLSLSLFSPFFLRNRTIDVLIPVIIFALFSVHAAGSYLDDHDDDSTNEWDCPHCGLAMNLGSIQKLQHMETCQSSQNQNGRCCKVVIINIHRCRKYRVNEKALCFDCKILTSGVPRGGVFKPPPKILKALQNCAKLNPIALDDVDLCFSRMLIRKARDLVTFIFCLIILFLILSFLEHTKY